MHYYHYSNSKCLFLEKNAADVYFFYRHGLQDFVDKKNTRLEDINVTRDILSLKNDNNP